MFDNPKPDESCPYVLTLDLTVKQFEYLINKVKKDYKDTNRETVDKFILQLVLKELSVN